MYFVLMQVLQPGPSIYQTKLKHFTHTCDTTKYIVT